MVTKFEIIDYINELHLFDVKTYQELECGLFSSHSEEDSKQGGNVKGI